jgi:hypothetical protein
LRQAEPLHSEAEIQSETGGLRESGIRIGVILPEDARTQLSLELPASAAFEISWAGGSQVLDPTGEPGSGLERILTAGSEPDLSLTFESSQAVLRAGEWLTLTPVTPQRLIRGDGIRIRQVPAGRSFHIAKQINQTL